MTYLTYRVEDALFTWKKENDVDGFWVDLTWDEYIAFLQQEKQLLQVTKQVLTKAVLAFPIKAFDFALPKEEVVFPVARFDNTEMLHMARLYTQENQPALVEFLMLQAERAYYPIWKKSRGSYYTWELYIMELLRERERMIDPLSRAFRGALAQLDFLSEWKMIYPTIQKTIEAN